jgi:hypothetical protein
MCIPVEVTPATDAVSTRTLKASSKHRHAWDARGRHPYFRRLQSVVHKLRCYRRPLLACASEGEPSPSLHGLESTALWYESRTTQSFRSRLTVNPDLINSLNNTISGGVALYAISKGSGLLPGPACTANAYIGQFTVQATDFNILLMSIVVLLTVTNEHIYRRPSRKQIAMLCAAPWIPGLITGTRSSVLQ